MFMSWLVHAVRRKPEREGRVGAGGIRLAVIIMAVEVGLEGEERRTAQKQALR